jgi:pyrroline-5-carboxylate reductase
MAQLLEQGMSFDMILARVTVPGGITACGLEAMGDTPLNLFTLLHQVTQGFSHGQQTTPQGLAKEI